MKYLIAFLVLLTPLAAAAQGAAPRSIADCEQVQGDLAYNQCLASFGPRVGAPRATAASRRGVRVRTVRGRGSYRRSAGYRRGARVASGRKRASFAVVSGGTRASRAAPRTRTARRRR